MAGFLAKIDKSKQFPAMVMNIEAKIMYCIDACNACVTACNYCASSCLGEEHVIHQIRCVNLALQCAASCQAAAQLMLLKSNYTAEFCAVCVKICNECAEECEKHAAMDMEHCRICAEACRRCQGTCESLALAA
jgi:hypothetical protein